MDKIIENLKKQLKHSQPPTITQEDELALFTKCLREEREALHHDETLANRKLNTHKDVTKAYSQQHMPTIPQFYEHIPNDPLGKKLRDEARALFIHRKSQEIISSDEANSLLTLLEENASSPLDPESPKINYDDFMKVVQKASPAIANLFPPTIFADLYQNDPYGRVRILDLYQYTMRKIWYHHSRMGLSLYDSIGQGFLRESDLEDYLYELIPTMRQLAQLQETFHKFYVCTAVRKFFFFLDPLRTGRIAIPDILCSGYLDKLLELREEDADIDDLEQNWFSCQSASKIYTRYLQLDKDHNGLLSRDELARYNSSTLTPVFITRVFQECLTYNGEMDYKSYLDFVLALDNRNSAQGLRYLFQIMDIDNKGYLHPGDLNFFYRGMIQMLSTRPLTDIPPFNNVQNEIFDMVKPVNSMHITLKDLINCGQGGLVLSILIDIGSFWTYENRESLIPQQAPTKDDSIHINNMNTNKSSSYLHQFSWEEWDNQIIVVLYRSDRRFVVKRYIERVLANSTQWQRLAKSSFSNIEPIAQAYTMTENEVKLMHHIFSWHLNGTLTFPIIGGLDQLLDWEDILDFIQRIERASKNDKQDELIIRKSPSMIPTIPIGILSSTISIKKTVEKNKNLEDLETEKEDITPINIHKKARQQQIFDENTSSSSSLKNHWVQINNICVPYIIKSSQKRLLPYQILLDCNLFNEQEQSFIFHLTTKANSNDIQTFERIISSSSSIDFKLSNDLLLIDLYHLLFGMSKVVYVKLLNNQRHVNKSYKTVLAQCGGTVVLHSHSIPFISLGKLDYVLLDSLIAILQPTTKTISSLRRRSVPAQSHEIDYLRLVQFYQQKHHQDDDIISTQQQQQLLINIDDIQKYVNENDLVIDMLLTQYQQNEYRKLQKETTENKPTRKPTKRKASTAMTELRNVTPK